MHNHTCELPGATFCWAPCSNFCTRSLDCLTTVPGGCDGHLCVRWLTYGM